MYNICAIQSRHDTYYGNQLCNLQRRLEDQLFDENLMRLWRTGGFLRQYNADEDKEMDVSTVSILLVSLSNLPFIFLKLSSYMSRSEDYALSKDVDVVLWMDSRAFHGQPPLTDALDFVIVNCQLHDDPSK